MNEFRKMPDAEGWYWFRGRVKPKSTRRWSRNPKETICNVFRTKRGYHFPFAVFVFGDFYELNDFDGEWLRIESPWKDE